MPNALTRTMSAIPEEETSETGDRRPINLNVDIEPLLLFTMPSNKYVISSISVMLSCHHGDCLERFLRQQNIVQTKFLKEFFFDITRPERFERVSSNQKILVAHAITFGFPARELVQKIASGETKLSEQTVYDIQFKIARLSDPLVADMVNDGGIETFLNSTHVVSGQVVDTGSFQWWDQAYSKY